MLSLLARGAPNLHPLIVHFPIALVLTAVALDVLALILPRPGGLALAAFGAYAAGAASAVVAYWTGRAAAATVLVPGMAHGLVQDHRTWATATSWYLVAFVAVRLAAQLAGLLRTRRHRAAFAFLGLIGALLVQQTAERGGRLVFEQGVGVIRTTLGR